MSNLIKWVLIAGTGLILLCGCATDRLMKQEDFSLEQEKAKAVPIQPRPSAVAPAAPVEKPVRTPLDGKTITLKGSHPEPGGGNMSHRAIWKIIDTNNQTFDMYGTHHGQKEMKVLEITYTRKE